jgi:hypothetical protein
MAKKTKKGIYDCPATLDDLLDAMKNPSGGYQHLQIILKRDNTTDWLGLGQKYLVVNKNGFGVYQLNDVDYNDGKIVMRLTNPATGNRAEISLDINNKHPQVVLVCWDDIRDMVYAERTNNFADDILLELDTD